MQGPTKLPRTKIMEPPSSDVMFIADAAGVLEMPSSDVMFIASCLGAFHLALYVLIVLLSVLDAFAIKIVILALLAGLASCAWAVALKYTAAAVFVAIGLGAAAAAAAAGTLNPSARSMRRASEQMQLLGMMGEVKASASTLTLLQSTSEWKSTVLKGLDDWLPVSVTVCLHTQIRRFGDFCREQAAPISFSIQLLTGVLGSCSLYTIVTTGGGPMSLLSASVQVIDTLSALVVDRSAGPGPGTAQDAESGAAGVVAEAADSSSSSVLEGAVDDLQTALQSCGDDLPRRVPEATLGAIRATESIVNETMTSFQQKASDAVESVANAAAPALVARAHAAAVGLAQSLKCLPRCVRRVLVPVALVEMLHGTARHAASLAPEWLASKAASMAALVSGGAAVLGAQIRTSPVKMVVALVGVVVTVHEVSQAVNPPVNLPPSAPPPAAPPTNAWFGLGDDDDSTDDGGGGDDQWWGRSSKFAQQLQTFLTAAGAVATAATASAAVQSQVQPKKHSSAQKLEETRDELVRVEIAQAKKDQEVRWAESQVACAAADDEAEASGRRGGGSAGTAPASGPGDGRAPPSDDPDDPAHAVCKKVGTTYEAAVVAEELDWKGKGLSAADAPAVVEVLSACTRLRAVDLGGNGLLGDAGATTIGAGLLAGSAAAIPRTLEVLDFSDCGIGAAGCAALVADGTPLTKLVLANNAQIKEAAVVAIGAGLRGNARLQELDLSKCGIGGAGCDALVAGTALRALSLATNAGIKDAGAVALGESLRGNTSLQVLDLTKCGITAVGAKALVGATTGATVTKLVLSSNPLKDDGAVGLGALLRGNTSLKELHVEYCGITAAGGTALVTDGVHLRKLVLSNNPIRDDGATALGGALRGNTSIEQLELVRCGIGPPGKEALRAVAAGRASLQILGLTPTAAASAR